MGSDIKPIPAEAVHRIVAGQAVTDLASAVKELVDNALDAGSKSINIRLFNQGADIVEVSDDGCGVPMASRPVLATAHATSKIQAFDEIYQEDASLGFRGEALFCLSNLSGKLFVATRTADEEVAQKLEFQRDGSLKSTEEMPRKIGTTVAVVGLFEAVPVRRADMLRSMPKQRGKLMKCMESYAIFSTGVRIHLMDIVEGKESTLLATTANSRGMSETISSVLGSKFLASLSPVTMSLDDVFANDREKAEPPQWRIEGYISTAVPSTSTQKAPARPVQYYCINGRPVQLPAVNRLLNDIWRTSFGQAKKPSCILRLTIPASSFDINVDADKRRVIFTQEPALLDKIQHFVSIQWSNQTNGQFAQQLIAAAAEEVEEVPVPDSPAGEFQRRNAFAHDFANATLQHETATSSRRKRPRRGGAIPGSPANVDGPVDGDDTPLTAEQQEARAAIQKRQRCIDTNVHQANLGSAAVTPSPAANEDMPLPSSPHVSPPRRTFAEERRWQQAQASFNHKPPALQDDLSTLQAPVRVASNRSNRNDPAAGTEKLTKFGFERLGYRAKPKRVSVDKSAGNNKDCASETAEETLSPGGIRRVSRLEEEDPPVNDNSAAQSDPANVPPREASEQEHSPPVTWGSFQNTAQVIQSSRKHRLAMRDRKRVLQPNAARPAQATGASKSATPPKRTVSLSKQDFRENMRVIGQFNMGFILAKTRDNHLWILDQHACDEKYNFEKLCKETVLHEQRLMAPLPLELSPAEEICVLDHMSIFEKNGFRFQVDESKPPRHRLALTALPHSGARDGRKAVQFGKEDVAALCSILGADGSSSSYGDGGGTGMDGSGKSGNNAVRRHAGTVQGGPVDRVLARLPKAIAMFASRACRGSIMIGKALSETEMTGVVQRLGDLEQPWQCPHGRNTLQHVGDLKSLLWRDKRKAAAMLAGPTLTVMSQEENSQK